MAVDAGFQRTTLPTMAGVPARFPPIAVKLNGEMAAIKPWRKFKYYLICWDVETERARPVINKIISLPLVLCMSLGWLHLVAGEAQGPHRVPGIKFRSTKQLAKKCMLNYV